MPAYAQLLVILAAMVGFWAIVMRPARNQQRKVQQLQHDLEVGQEVVLSAGIFGTIRSLTRRGPRSRWRLALSSRWRARSSYAGWRTSRTPAGPDHRPDPDGPDPRPRTEEKPAPWQRRRPRPGRTLLIFGLAIVAPVRHRRARQDLEAPSGTRPRGRHPHHAHGHRAGGAITQTKLKQAASIVDSRVNGSGVSEAEVSTQGNRNIIVEIPGKNASSLVDAVKRTAQLRFRIVAGTPQPGIPAPQQSQSASPSSKASPSSTAHRAARPPKPSSKATKTPKVNKATPKPRPGAVRDKLGADPHALESRLDLRRDAGSAQRSPATPADGQGGLGRRPDGMVSRTPAPSGCRSSPRTPARRRARTPRPVADNADEPLITCDDKGQKFLLPRR